MWLATVAGGLGASFWFYEHPNGIIAAVADRRADHRRLRDLYRCDDMDPSLEEKPRKEKRSMP